MYRALRKWAGVLMRTAQLGAGTWRPLLWMDSTTAVSKWVGVSVPSMLDHACAKEKRFLGWAEKVAYVAWMDFDMRWIPGSANDFADLLSRSADKLRQCLEERSASVMETARVHHYGKEGYEESHLVLGADDWAEVRRAYLEDEGTIQSVMMSDLYRCVCMDGEGVSPEMRIKVGPWVGRRYFCVQPPGSDGAKVVYTQRTQLREQWEQKDHTRVLVLLVPSGADVRVTTAEEVVDREEAREWEVVDLRRDLLMACHDNAGHPKHGATLTALKSMAYWPTMAVRTGKDSVQRHLDLCAHCTAHQRMTEAVGLGVEELRRMWVVVIDHMILEDDQARMAGCIGVLSAVDVATRVGIFVAVQSQSARATAEALLEYWIPYFGVPAVLVSDPASGFTAEVMAEIRRIVGIAEHDVAASRAKGKVAIVERSHRQLREILADGFSKGDITSLTAFKMYLSMAMQRRNHFERDARSGPMELWCGQQVRQIRSLAMTDPEVDCLESIPEGSDREFVAKLRGLVGEQMEFEHHMRDEVARKNALRRDKQDQTIRYTGARALQVAEGDEVSHEGRSAVLKGKHGEPGRPVTATIEVETQKGQPVEKRVRFDELRTPAAAIPVKMLPKEASVGSFVLWMDSEGFLCGGTVVTVGDATLEVWLREQDSGAGKNWYPTWLMEDGSIRRSGVPPSGAERNMGSVEVGLVRLTGQLTEKHRMTDATWRAAVAAGIT